MVKKIKSDEKELSEESEEPSLLEKENPREEKTTIVKKKESSEEKEEKKAKFSKLLEKAKALEGKVEDAKELDVSKVKKKTSDEQEVEKETLVPMDDYLKASIHLGTRVITPDMRPYVYRRRADGLAVFNTALLDDKIREGGEFLSKFSPENIIIVCKREAGWKAVRLFSEVTGIRSFTKKYPAGILTNTTLDNFTEADLILICDPWLDKNAIEDANRMRIPVLSICDTNNFTRGVTTMIPGNNKSAKSLGMILHLLTRIYVEKRKLDVPIPPIQNFVEGWDEAQAPD